MKAMSWFLVLIWIASAVVPPILVQIATRTLDPDSLQSIAFRTHQWVAYPFIDAWLAPLSLSFWVFAAVCLARSRAGRWWKQAALGAWCIPWGVWAGALTQTMRPVDRWLALHGLALPTGDPLLDRIDTQLAMALTLSGLISAAILGAITRSRVVLGASLLAAPLGFGWMLIGEWAASPWLAVVCGATMLWSRRSRQRASEGRCSACEYDLAGVPSREDGSVRCPECGAIVSRQHPSSNESSATKQSANTPNGGQG